MPLETKKRWRWTVENKCGSVVGGWLIWVRLRRGVDLNGKKHGTEGSVNWLFEWLSNPDTFVALTWIRGPRRNSEFSGRWERLSRCNCWQILRRQVKDKFYRLPITIASHEEFSRNGATYKYTSTITVSALATINRPSLGKTRRQQLSTVLFLSRWLVCT